MARWRHPHSKALDNRRTLPSQELIVPKTNAKQLLFLLALTCCGAAFADTDPTLQQVYTAANSGHLEQAQQMMNQVLRDHPNSAKAHYVAAEIYAKQGNFSLAREELSGAERLEPGLPFAKSQAVQALKTELSTPQPRAGAVAGSSSFPWGMALAVFAGLAVFWMVMRRRSSGSDYLPARPMTNTSAGMPGSYGSPGTSGGMGSGIVGGLASGLAVGAGVVAAEELAHHFLGGDRRMGNGMGPLDHNGDYPPINNDMGGSDFGITDPGSWDDGGSVDSDTRGGDWG
jgi:hypothetical protein